MSSQGASNGPGQGAGRSFVQFSRQSAQRIAKVVRTVEQGDRNQSGITFDHPIPSVASPLKVATFTGSWATGTYKTVTLVGSTNTASVYNWCNAAEGDGTATRHVVFGRASGTNSVLEIAMGATSTCRMTLGGVDLTSLTGYAAGDVQVLGHNTTGPCLQWYSVTTCSTSTAA